MIDYKKIDTGIPIKEFTVDSIRNSKFVNMQYFREAALEYESNERLHGVGVYCRAPVGSKEFVDYWDLQTERCKEGFTVGDVYITGRQYFYLNFFRMMRSVERSDKERNKVSAQTEKREGFPSFWAIQWLWFNFTHIARYGGTFLGVHSEGGLDICGLKTRGAGFSFMDAADDVYNYNFIRDSKSYVMASTSMYLDGVDGFMPKVQVALDFLNTGTRGLLPNKELSAGYWAKNRLNVAKEPMIFKSGYKDINGNTYGFNSLIGAIICDDVQKARGARGMKITLEEGGSFNNLMSLEALTLALVKDGGYKTGSRSLFGTGGELGSGIEGLEKIFNNPRAFGFMAFPNIWEGEMDEIGFFCPSFLADASVIDANGNSDIDKHIERQNTARDAKQSVSQNDKEKYIAEFPFVPSEALRRVTGNIFPLAEIEAQIKRIEFRKINNVTHGSLELADLGKIEFKPNANAKPILVYPHDQDSNLNGAISVLQRPYVLNGSTPKGMYFIVVDNYGIDDAIDKTSLFAAYVYKYYNPYDVSYCNVPVAWYVGRPASQENEAFENLLRLSMWYGEAEIMSELNASGQQIITFFRNKHKYHLLMDEIDVTSNTNIEKKRKGKFMRITRDSKLQNLQYFVNNLMEERYEDEDEDMNTVMIRNIHLYEDLGILNEMKKFKLDKYSNFDRVSACSMAPLIMKQKIKIGMEILTERSSLATTNLFSSFHYSDNGLTISEY